MVAAHTDFECNVRHARAAIARGAVRTARRHIIWARLFAHALPSSRRRIAHLRVGLLDAALRAAKARWEVA